MKYTRQQIAGRIAIAFAAISISTVGSVVAESTEAQTTSGITISGNVQQLNSVSEFAATGSKLFANAETLAASDIVASKFYRIRGALVNGRWSNAFSVTGPVHSTVETVELGSNDLDHSQLVAVGSPSESAPVTSTLMRGAAGNRLSPATTLSSCLPSYKQAQAQTLWYEYDPNNPPGHIQMGTLTTDLGYNYGNGAVNCVTGTDSSGEYPTWTSYGHSFGYSGYGTYASAASNITFSGQSLDNRGCVQLDVNSQNLQGDSSGYATANVNTHAYFCGTGTSPGDFFYQQMTHL